MSRFVPAGSEGSSETTASDEAWQKAREQIDTARKRKPVEAGKQEDGRSLYEVLQANKAAKQEAFEEATKLRNQFRALEDTEIEFLDSVRETERLKEAVAKQETLGQLDEFRKRRAAAEQEMRQRELDAQTAKDQLAAATKAACTEPIWTATKKRRRVAELGEGNPASRVKLVPDTNARVERKDMVPSTATNVPVDIDTADASKSTVTNTTVPNGAISAGTLPVIGLGLTAYESDDDD